MAARLFNPGVLRLVMSHFVYSGMGEKLKKIRMTIDLESDLIKELRKVQSYMIRTENRSVSFNEVIIRILKKQVYFTRSMRKI